MEPVDYPAETWKCSIYLAQFDDLFMEDGNVVTKARKASGTISNIQTR